MAFTAKLLKIRAEWLTLNQRVPGSSPGAPTIQSSETCSLTSEKRKSRVLRHFLRFSSGYLSVFAGRLSSLRRFRRGRLRQQKSHSWSLITRRFGDHVSERWASVRSGWPRMAGLETCARSGETSSETHPSTPLVRSQIGRNRSAACAKSSIASSKNSVSPDFPSLSGSM
jgi:hypothetical protein